MRIRYGQAGSASGISRINPEEHRLYPAIAEMLVDQMTLPEDFHFQIDAIGELGAIGGEFQPVISMGANIIYLAPDPAIAVRSPFDGQELPRVPGNPAKIHLAGLYSRYLSNIPLPALGQLRCVPRYLKSRVGDEVGCLFCPGKISKEGKPQHQADQD